MKCSETVSHSRVRVEEHKKRLFSVTMKGLSLRLVKLMVA